MKLHAKICPKKCRALVQPHSRGRQILSRMTVIASMIERSHVRGLINEGVDYSKAWILNYVCPVCGTTIPITADDIFLSSRRPTYYGTSRKRQRERKADEREAQMEAENK